MSQNPTKPPTKPENSEEQKTPKTAFDKPESKLFISHGNKRKLHRILFKSKEITGNMSVDHGVFQKLLANFPNLKENAPMTYYKNKSFTFGLSKHGKIVMYVRSDLDVFPKEFLRVMRNIFKLNDDEIRSLILHLDFVECEVAHKINDPFHNLKDAHIEYTLDELVRKLHVYVDNSDGSLEFEIRGDPETSTNLEYLTRDKLGAVLFFHSLTKTIEELTRLTKSMGDGLESIRNGVYFLIDHILSDPTKPTKQTTKPNEENENGGEN